MDQDSITYNDLDHKRISGVFNAITKAGPGGVCQEDLSVFISRWRDEQGGELTIETRVGFDTLSTAVAFNSNDYWELKDKASIAQRNIHFATIIGVCVKERTVNERR